MQKNLSDRLRKELAADLVSALQFAFSGFELEVKQVYEALVIPPNLDFGHLAFGCFQLSKSLKQSPAGISQQVAKVLESRGSYLFSKVQAVGPYVNFHITGQAFTKFVVEPIQKGTFFTEHLFAEAPKSMIEFSQPNTHKELHVGHMRNACLGDALVRLMRYSGISVVSTTFPGDVGTHVAKCLWYLKFHNQEPVPTQDRGEWLGKMYSKGHIKLEDEAGTTKEIENKTQLTEILKQLENKQGEYFELWKETKQWSLELMNQVYAWADIKFDQWYWESDVDSSSVKWVKELFAQGKLVESQGAIGMDLSDQNIGFCVLLKSDGNGLYATKDIELARRKFNDFHIEHSIYVVDMRQALHFKQVFAVLERLGFEQAKNCYHLQYNFVELPDGAMSSRKGNIVPIIDLIHQMEDHVKTNYLARYASEWSTQEIQMVAEVVAKGAIKYGMLRIDPNKKIVFDMTEWLKIDGESGPYIQYAYARIQSVLRKFKDDLMGATLNGELLNHKLESELALLLSNFNNIIATSAEQHKPSLVCNYLYDLAKKFSAFYTECPIGYAESQDLKANRLLLAQATALTLKQGLALLGIPVPERM